MDRSPVALLRWPRDAVERDVLEVRGRPCLLLVEGETAPPHVRELEDWIRVPADERDLLLRIEALETRCAAPRARPLLSDGVLRTEVGSVVLSPHESSLVDRLLVDFERVVGRGDLERAVWGAHGRTPRGLDSLLARVRPRIGPLGLVIAAVRGRGLTLARGETPDA
jgi:two-component system, OmpR family, response regulator